MAGNHKIGYTEKKETNMFPSGPAKILLERMHTDDLHGFEEWLTHPLAVEALNGNDGLVFHKACDHSNIGFARAALPHTLPQYIGKEVTYSVACRNMDLFETLITCDATVFDHIHPKTLHLLAQRCLDVRNTPYSQHNVEQDMLVLFLDTAPKHITDQQLQQMYTTQASTGSVSLIEDLLAQRQYKILEKEVKMTGHTTVARKI